MGGVEWVGDRLSSAASSSVGDCFSSAASAVDGSIGRLRGDGSFRRNGCYARCLRGDGSFGLLRNGRRPFLRGDGSFRRLRNGRRPFLRGDGSFRLLRRAADLAVAARLLNPSFVPSPDRNLRRSILREVALALDAAPMLAPMPATWQAMLCCFVLPGRSQLASWLLSCYSLAGLQRSLPSRDSRCCLQPVHHGCRKRGGLVALFLACGFFEPLLQNRKNVHNGEQT